MENKTELITRFIIENVDDHKSDIVSYTAAQFEISKQAAWKHIHKLVETGVLESTGNTKGKEYKLKVTASALEEFALTSDLNEDSVWANLIRPQLADVKPNVLKICQHGFTEMFNNAIDHSEGSKVKAFVGVTAVRITLTIIDDGVGIFHKIQSQLKLDDPKQSILELAKGKFTTDSKRHSGEGIFFTSRMFDDFYIFSHNISFISHKGDDWLYENKKEYVEGTYFTMVVSQFSDVTIKSVFDRYATSDDYGFNRTNVPVKLAEAGDDNLISRSQAKRLLTRFDRFQEVILDFKGVTMIGQAFADEIFRVFANEHPEVHLYPGNMEPNVAQMVNRALKLKAEQAKDI